MDNGKFTYNYTAPTQKERREIEEIRRRYSDPGRGKLERLRALDSKVKRAPMALGVTLGVIGTLIFGLGLTMVLEWRILWWGIAVMLVGCVPIAFAHYAYSSLSRRNKKKYAAEILKLSEELLDGGESE